MSGTRAVALKNARRATSVVSLVAMVLALLTVIGVQNAAAADSPILYVGGSDASDANPCSQDQPCATITRAVAQASDGSTIDVAPGHYSEAIIVDKSLTIQGAQASSDPTVTVPAQDAQSIIDASGTGSDAIDVRADDVTIEGMTIVSDSGASAVRLRGDNQRMTNDIIVAGLIGVTSYGTNVTLTDNLVRLNHASSNGFSNQAHQDGENNWLVTGNHFEMVGDDVINQNIYGADINHSPGNHATSHVTITGNTSTTQATLVALNNVSDAKVSGNTSDGIKGSGIWLAGGVTDSTISDNTITHASTAIAVLRFSDAKPINSGLTVTGNDLSGAVGAALTIAAGSYDGTLNASENWWGTADGPSAGDVVNDPGTAVTLSPWCTDTGCTTSTESADRYVAVDGVDAGVCADQGDPCGSINYAISQAAAGDTVHVSAGVHHETVTITKPIRLIGAGRNATTIDGSGIPSKTGIVHVGALSTAGDVTISGLTLTNPTIGSAPSPYLVTLADTGVDGAITISENSLIEGNADSDKFVNGPVGIVVHTVPRTTTLIENNLISGVSQGILLEHSGPTTVRNNTFERLIETLDGATVWPAEGLLVLSDHATTQSLVTADGNTFRGYAGFGLMVKAGYTDPGCSVNDPCHGSAEASFTDNTFALGAASYAGAQYSGPTSAIYLEGALGDSVLDANLSGNSGHVQAPSLPLVVAGDPGATVTTTNDAGKPNTIITTDENGANQLSLALTPPNQMYPFGRWHRFTAVVHNGSKSAVPAARYQITLTASNGVDPDDITLQYQDGDDRTWEPAHLIADPDDGNVLTGYLGAVGGTEIPAGDSSVTLRIKAAPGTSSGTVTIDGWLVRIGPDGDIVNVLTTPVAGRTEIAEVTCDPSLFQDVSGGIFCADISWLAGMRVTTGTDATHFDPAGGVTRGQMAMFLYRLVHHGDHAQRCAGTPFDDVAEGSRACGAITWLGSTGITTGTDATHFDPAGGVTRGQMAMFLYRLVHHGDHAQRCAGTPFDDVAEGSRACGAITWLGSTGITTGNEVGLFAPGDAISRAQMAAFLHRMVNRVGI